MPSKKFIDAQLNPNLYVNCG